MQYLWLLNVVSVCPAVFLSWLFELCGISVAFLLCACVCVCVCPETEVFNVAHWRGSCSFHLQLLLAGILFCAFVLFLALRSTSIVCLVRHRKVKLNVFNGESNERVA